MIGMSSGPYINTGAININETTDSPKHINVAQEFIGNEKLKIQPNLSYNYICIDFLNVVKTLISCKSINTKAMFNMICSTWFNNKLFIKNCLQNAKFML